MAEGCELLTKIDAPRNALLSRTKRRGCQRLVKSGEEGINCVLQITMADDTQILLGLHTPQLNQNTSEIAALNFLFLRGHGLSVPCVHAYSSNGKNPVGSEYILVGKLSGRPLGDLTSALAPVKLLLAALLLVLASPGR